MYKKINACLLLIGITFTGLSNAGTLGTYESQRRFYAGITSGYGSTTWQGLVPALENQNLALSMSTPIQVQEGGFVWGFFAGHEFSPYFALEANYIHYPTAEIFFDPDSLFSFDHDRLTRFSSKTETVNLMGKIMLLTPNAHLRIYSSLGAAGVHRQDILASHWRLSPTFGAGLNYQLTPRIMGELGANYTAGFGESQLNPTETYYPFLYSVFLRLAYCF